MCEFMILKVYITTVIMLIYIRTISTEMTKFHTKTVEFYTKTVEFSTKMVEFYITMVEFCITMTQDLTRLNHSPCSKSKKKHK